MAQVEGKTESVCITKFRRMRIKDYRALESVLLIEEYSDRPIAVLMPYSKYLEMQTLIIKISEGLDGLANT